MKVKKALSVLQAIEIEAQIIKSDLGSGNYEIHLANVFESKKEAKLVVNALNKLIYGKSKKVFNIDWEKQ